MIVCPNSCKKTIRKLVLVALFGLAIVPTSTRAQEQRHVVSAEELKQDSKVPGESRQANEAAIRELISSEAGQKALKAAQTDYQKIDRAVSQLSDEDTAKLAERSRQAQNDFAAGRLSDRDLLWIILIIVAVLIIALAVR
jgi:hypothetical protein